jgi:hypothetical protein
MEIGWQPSNRQGFLGSAQPPRQADSPILAEGGRMLSNSGGRCMRAAFFVCFLVVRK